MILVVDPGIRGCGVAVFSDRGWLKEAKYVKNEYDRGDGPAECRAMAMAIGLWYPLTDVKEVVIEWPRVYTAGKQKGDANDLLPLVGVGVALCALYPLATATRYFPHEWKGQMTKETTQARILSRLTPEEALRVGHAGAKTHNIFDAVGIGLFRCGRFNPTRVIAR